MTEQFSSMERDAFHIPYLSDKIPEAVFHGQAVRTVAYLRGTVQLIDFLELPLIAMPAKSLIFRAG